MRDILEIAKDLPHDYTTLTGQEVSTDPGVSTGYERTYADSLALRFEADGRVLFIWAEYGVTMPDGADPDVDEGVHEVIGYTWAAYDLGEEGADPIFVDGTESELTATETIADFMDRAS